MSKEARGKIAPDDSTLWKCNWLNCVHGCGLAGSGICSRDGEWDNPKCKQFCKRPKHLIEPPPACPEKHCTNPNIGCINGGKEAGCKTSGYITSDLPGGNGTCPYWQPKEQPAAPLADKLMDAVKKSSKQAKALSPAGQAEMPLLSEKDQTKALDRIPFGDLRSQKQRDNLCQAQRDADMDWHNKQKALVASAAVKAFAEEVSKTIPALFGKIGNTTLQTHYRGEVIAHIRSMVEK
jgi:hypothetical protein